jgi:Cys-rich protein (TIGR04453 family)
MLSPQTPKGAITMIKHILILIAIPLAFAHCDSGGSSSGDAETGAETGAEETGAETGAEETGAETGAEETGGEAIDCDAYCGEVADCAGEWDATRDDVLDGCLEGCNAGTPEEMQTVASCLDASTSCEDTFNCIPNTPNGDGDICDEYCGPVGDCAEEWGTTTQVVVDSCLDGCTDASEEEQQSVADCLDASESCDDIFACIPE